jgi:LemA protein
MRKILNALLLLTLATLLSGCGYNTIQQKDEAVNAAWSQVLNVYKRRADLVPNLVATVKGYASHEERVFTEVTEARAKVGSINVNANDPNSLAQFQAAQTQLQGALSRLLVVSEQYPQLKADQNFLQLQAQLEGTENRITVERQRYIATVQDFNTYIRQFPTNITAKMFGYKPRPNFTVENEAQISTAPTVDFGTAPPAQPAPQAMPQPTPQSPALPPSSTPAPSNAPATAPQG